MRWTALLCVLLLAGCSDDREKTAGDFMAGCKKENGVLSVTYTVGGWGGQSVSMTCTPKALK